MRGSLQVKFCRKAGVSPERTLSTKHSPGQTVSIHPKCREGLLKVGELGCRWVRDVLVEG